MSGAALRVWLNAVSGGAPASGSTVRGNTSWILRIRTRVAREIVRLQQDPGHRLASRAPAPERSVAMIRKRPGRGQQAMEWMLHPHGGPDCPASPARSRCRRGDAPSVACPRGPQARLSTHAHAKPGQQAGAQLFARVQGHRPITAVRSFITRRPPSPSPQTHGLQRP